MSFPHRLATICLIAVAAIGLAGAALAEPPAGSKNFASPGFVPNYFSNEAGPVMRNPAPLPAGPAPAPIAAPLPAAPASAPVTAAPPLAPQPRPVIIVERQPTRHAAKTASSRDRHRASHVKATASDKHKPAVASRTRTAKSVVKISAKTDRPRSTKLAHVEPHAAKARPAAKAQHTSTGDKHSRRG